MNETQTLARFVVESRWGDIPQPVRHDAKRALLNWLGCALGGCRDETVERALAAFDEFSGPRKATLIGRHKKTDVLHAALINAIASNILDFDDTHMRTVIHPTVPVAATLCALAEHHPATGAQFVQAFVLGVEVECRIGNAVSPQHYAHGWHISTTCGVFGAAAAAGKLLGLNSQQMAWALGIAATQASGLTEMLGSMTKSYNLGHAAKAGLLAALLAEKNFTSSERGIEAPAGFAHVLGNNPKLNELTDRLGTTWELSGNACKPFPCGIVLHAAIDACLQLRNEFDIRAEQIARVDIRMNPHALELAGKPSPTTGLEGKLSARHVAAAALLYGTLGVAEVSDDCVHDPAVVALREKVATHADETLAKVGAHVVITLHDGRRLERHVPHAIGSLEKPMSDADIEKKFHALAAASRSECHAWDAIEITWSLERLNDAAKFVQAAAPEYK